MIIWIRGEIILQRETTIGDEETVGALHDKLMYLGAELVKETVDLIAEGTVTTTKQPELKEKKPAHKLFPKNCKIDWSKPLADIYNHIRGLNPYPAAWTIFRTHNEEITAKIYGVSKEFITHEVEIGKVVTTKSIVKVAVNDGFLVINELKLSGKKLMNAKSVLNGYSFFHDAVAL